MYNGYFAIALDKQSCSAVKKSATMKVLVSDHITLAFKPSVKVFNKYKNLVGKKVGAMINGYRANNHIDAYNRQVRGNRVFFHFHFPPRSPTTSSQLLKIHRAFSRRLFRSGFLVRLILGAFSHFLLLASYF